MFGLHLEGHRTDNLNNASSNTYVMSRVLARTVADHLQLNSETLGYAYRVDCERLFPLFGIFGAFLQGDLCSELHHIAHLLNNNSIK